MLVGKAPFKALNLSQRSSSRGGGNVEIGSFDSRLVDARGEANMFDS